MPAHESPSLSREVATYARETMTPPDEDDRAYLEMLAEDHARELLTIRQYITDARNELAELSQEEERIRRTFSALPLAEKAASLITGEAFGVQLLQVRSEMKDLQEEIAEQEQDLELIERELATVRRRLNQNRPLLH